jgi:hypothetical protein
MGINNELEGKEVAVNYSEVLSEHMPEEKHEKSEWG